jgi:hypothetical protein
MLGEPAHGTHDHRRHGHQDKPQVNRAGKVRAHAGSAPIRAGSTKGDVPHPRARSAGKGEPRGDRAHALDRRPAVRERRPGGGGLGTTPPKKGHGAARPRAGGSALAVLREQALDEALRVVAELAEDDAHAGRVRFHAHHLALALALDVSIPSITTLNFRSTREPTASGVAVLMNTPLREMFVTYSRTN